MQRRQLRQVPQRHLISQATNFKLKLAGARNHLAELLQKTIASRKTQHVASHVMRCVWFCKPFLQIFYKNTKHHAVIACYSMRVFLYAEPRFQNALSKLKIFYKIQSIQSERNALRCHRMLSCFLGCYVLLEQLCASHRPQDCQHEYDGRH